MLLAYAQTFFLFLIWIFKKMLPDHFLRQLFGSRSQSITRRKVLNLIQEYETGKWS